MFDSIRCACAQGVVDLVKKVCYIGLVLADLASYTEESTRDTDIALFKSVCMG